jgi:hypothetical protein
MYINYIFNESIEKQFTAFNDGFLKVCDSKVLVSLQWICDNKILQPSMMASLKFVIAKFW